MTTTERPVLFSAPMVQALLAGRKTQTRRIAKPRRAASLLAKEEDGSNVWTDSYIFDPGNAEWLTKDAPAHAGEEMYVREAFRFKDCWDGTKPSEVPAARAAVFYEADEPAPTGLKVGRLRPGMHMPRWCSRIERTIVGCRLERLNACSAEDAIAEGLIWDPVLEAWTAMNLPGWPRFTDPVRAYAGLWQHINGLGSWDANPLVWVIEFSPS